MAESPEETEAVLTWVSHPMRRSWKKTAAAATFILLMGVVTGYIMEAPGFGLIAVLILFGSLAKFFLPTRYTFDDTGVTVKTTTQTFTRQWSVFRSYYTDKNGVLLSPFVVPSRLENFRGLYVTFDDNRDEAIAFLERHISAPEFPGESDELSKNNTNGAA